jgi:hypothetical protein
MYNGLWDVKRRITFAALSGLLMDAHHRLVSVRPLFASDLT